MASTLNPSGGLNFGFYDESRPALPPSSSSPPSSSHTPRRPPARPRPRPRPLPLPGTRDAAVVAPRRRRASGQARRDEAARDRPAGDRAARVRRRQRLRATIPLAGLRARNGGSVAGRWARGLVCGHGALPASAGLADSTHGDSGDAQGADRPDPGHLRPESLPLTRGDQRESPARASRRARRAVAGGPRPCSSDRATIRERLGEDARGVAT